MTPKERAFVEHMVNPPNPVAAAKQAGYRYPNQDAYRNMLNPAINAAIVAREAAALHNELLPIAVTQLRGLLENAGTPAGARVQAIKIVLDRTLGSGDDGARKELHEMTLEELERRRQQILDERANLAKPIVDVVPESGGNAQSAPNLFD